MVGDMILSVNKEEMIGIDYEMAANILKKTEGVINMWVANAARAAPPTPTISPDAAPTPTPSAGKTAPPTPAKNVEPKKPGTLFALWASKLITGECLKWFGYYYLRLASGFLIFTHILKIINASKLIVATS